MTFISKLKAMFANSGVKEDEKPAEPKKTESEEPEIDIDEEMLDRGVSFEPQTGEGCLEGLFNANEEDKQSEKKDDGGEEDEKKEEENKEE